MVSGPARISRHARRAAMPSCGLQGVLGEMSGDDRSGKRDAGRRSGSSACQQFTTIQTAGSGFGARIDGATKIGVIRPVDLCRINRLVGSAPPGDGRDRLCAAETGRVLARGTRWTRVITRAPLASRIVRARDQNVRRIDRSRSMGVLRCDFEGDRSATQMPTRLRH